ncbi:NAD(P)/FAD-dependent oxidoreductase [Glacieibacterium frigidum]|uniref:NADH:ubiquinone reductase (non-electrogenic) n=1 Tax=Glacieibacterium frigidum TaxID=2593303 RepID=A0A552UH33_9SPHN|nr:NAD(P)/FAD-dependent oxidoreductase [Glacieibacterium frigidum]TRW17529.1 NAD(P)/FAD-dependent oxidoreductase [Glacieibacterium frigidum]
MSKHHVVIVGAGFGGLAAARGLRRDDVRVTIIDKQNHHLFQPLLYQVATAGLSPAEIAAPIRTIVKDHGNTSVLLDEVCGVDVATRRVRLASGATVEYDSLILATGARHSYFGNDAWEAHAPGIKTLDDAVRVRRSILIAMERAETLRQENIGERMDFLTFVVIGGGPTGVEMAGAISELTRHAAEMDFRHITPKCLRIVLIEAGPRLLATFPEALGEAAQQSLEQLGVEVRLNSRVEQISAGSVTVSGNMLRAATIVWAAGVQASRAAAWLGVTGDRAGRVAVDPDMSVPGCPGVYAVGDTASIARADGRPVPGIAPAAKQQGGYVASVVAARIAGAAPPPPFRYRDHGNLATIGRKRAVADFGRVRLSGFPAWLLWSTSHIYFLVGFRSRVTVGLHWLWSYLTFERGARLITGLADMPDSIAVPQQRAA